MPYYVSLIKFTPDGIANIKDSPARLEAAKGAFKAMGGEMKGFYLTMGQYDMVVISEGPDDETAMKLAMTVAGAGAIRTETLRAFDEEEYMEIIAGLP